MNRRPNFRPSAQNLEPRRMMAADFAAETDAPASRIDGVSDPMTIGQSRPSPSSHESLDHVFTEMGQADENGNHPGVNVLLDVGSGS